MAFVYAREDDVAVTGFRWQGCNKLEEYIDVYGNGGLYAPLFCVLSIESGRHIDYRVILQINTVNSLDVNLTSAIFFSNIMFVSAKWGKVAVDKVTCNYKVFTYNRKS